MEMNAEVAVINVVSCSFFFFFLALRPDPSPCEYRNRCFLVALCPLCVHTASGGMDISEVLGSHFL